MPQLRQNPITGHWVVISPERAKRPSDFIAPAPTTAPRHGGCHFCVGGAAHAERIQEYDTKSTYLAPNKYPAFIADSTAASARSVSHDDQFYRARLATGGHDIIVINDPNVTIMNLTKQEWIDLLTTFQRRGVAYKQRDEIEVAMPIYNHKAAAGASVDHPHAQLFATSTIPNQITREVHGSFTFFERERHCVFCELILHEQKAAVRIVSENDTFVAYTFYAARFPFEVWVLPKVHHDRFETADSAVISGLATFLPTIFHRYDQVLHDPALNFWIHSLPNSLDQADFYHWHLEIAPRLTTYGGFELGSGVIIDMVSPERAALILRADPPTY